MARERNIIDEQILYALIAARKDDAKANLVEEVTVNEEDCMAVGIFNYKDMRTGKKVATRLYFISETVDGQLRNIIYDETGRPVAWQEEEEDMDLQVAGDVKLNRDLLRKQLVLADERARNGLPAPGEGENKAGEGRDLAKKEHEKSQEEKPKEEQKDKKEEGTETQEEEKGKEEQEQEGNQLRNLHYKINIDRNPKVCLNEIINGYYLWDILGIDEKLKGRLPDGLDPTAFRTGFLSFVDSNELDTLDASEFPNKEVKRRESKETFVIETLSGDIIELDGDVLKRKRLGTDIEKQKAEQSNLRFENGEEAEKPETNMAATRTSLFEIPDVVQRYAVGENWYLGVDLDEGYKRTGEIPAGGHTKNISFVQVSTKESYYNREERIQNSLEYKLRSIDEPYPTTKRAIRMQEQLRRKDPDEAQNVRTRHTKGLVEKCFQRYPTLGDYYNRSDITRKVEEYHSQGASDKEILSQIGKDAMQAEGTEHTRPLPGEGRRKH